MWEKFRKELMLNKKKHPLHHRNFEIDFILKYLPDLSWVNKKNIKVLDVGCCESLLVHELSKRGYDTYGIDIRDYTENPEKINFFKRDITDPSLPQDLSYYKFYYITALSTVEHIGLPCYGSKIIENGDRLALENINKLLDDNGYFIMTIPLKYWESNSGRGYTPKEFEKLIEDLFKIFELTHNGGQICASLIKF